MYFASNPWGGFANLYQGLRTVALLALVTGMKLRSKCFVHLFK